MNNRAAAFIKEYENAIAGSEPSAISAFYADVFIFGGPKGTKPIRKDDFLKVVPKRREWFTSVGLVESKVNLIEETSLDSKFSLVKTGWTMTFQKTGKVKRNMDTSATYILEWEGETGKIVFQIDHQDLAAKVNELGLT